MHMDRFEPLCQQLYILQRVYFMWCVQKSRLPCNTPEDEADDAYDHLRDRSEDDDEDCGNFNDGHDDDGVPFSRLQGEKWL